MNNKQKFLDLCEDQKRKGLPSSYVYYGAFEQGLITACKKCTITDMAISAIKYALLENEYLYRICLAHAGSWDAKGPVREQWVKDNVSRLTEVAANP